MRLITTENVLRYHELKETKVGMTIWFVRWLIGMGCLVGNGFFPAPWSPFIFLAGMTLLLPEHISFYNGIWRYSSKILRFGLLKPGQLVRYDPLRSHSVWSCQTKLFPVEGLENFRKYYNSPSKILLTYDDPSEPDPWQAYMKYQQEKIPIKDDDEIMLVVEQEYHNKKFWQRFDITSEEPKGSRVKVLYEGKLYWADPSQLRKVRVKRK